MKKILLFFILNPFILGCNQPPKNPEAVDPIVRSIQEDIKSAKEDIDKLKGKMEGTESDIAKAHPHDEAYANIVGEKESQLAQLALLNQSLRYFEIKLIKRVEEVRAKSLIAWKQGQIYSPDKDLHDYLAAREYSEMPRDWSENVPKMDDPLTDFKKEQRKNIEKRQRDRRAAAGI